MSVDRITFVGQQDIANDLGRSFDADQGRWSLSFVATGAEAIGLLKSQECDAIVTDIQLPDMSAIELLRQIQDKSPTTARLILSSTNDYQAVIESLGVAHQVLSKSCQLDVLKKQIANSLAIRSALNDRGLHARIAKIDKLPVLPSVYSQLVSEMQSESASAQKIADLVRRDVAITARVLQMINSAHFGVSRRVEGVLQAVNLLGLDIVKSLVLAAGVFCQFKESGLPGFLLDEIYSHCLTVGTNAQHLAHAFGLSRGQAEEALTAGTLHDIGKLILVTNFEKETREVIRLVDAQNLLLHDAERQVLGVSHCEIGAYLLSLWGLSDHVLQAVAFHDAPKGVSHPTVDVLAAVHLANAFDHDQQMQIADPMSTIADVEYLNQIGIGNQLKYLRTLAVTP
jgi:putative nucleotidyltransferase with HDIG domain